jgi:hypothetical protein
MKNKLFLSIILVLHTVNTFCEIDYMFAGVIGLPLIGTFRAYPKNN